MKSLILASVFLLSLNLHASSNSENGDDGNLSTQAASGDLQNLAQSNREALKTLKQALVDAKENVNQICLTGQWLMLDVINMKERRNFLDSVESNLIESFNLKPNEQRKNNIRKLSFAYRNQIEIMRSHMSPNQNTVESLIDKDDERVCAANTLSLAKQIEKMMIETQNMLSLK